jgi:hypothetical protein
MSRFTTTVSSSLAAACAAAVVVLPGAVLAPGAAATAYVLQQVAPSDLGPSRPWSRLQDTPGNTGRAAGVQEVSPFADGARFNGSLHLAVAAGRQAQQSQATHYFNRKVPLSSIAAATPSYDMYVRGWTSSPGAVAAGASLQLPVYCQGALTTLSFQPQLAADSLGHRGAVADTWRHFVAGSSSLWSTSRTVAGLAARTNHPLSAYVAACKAPGDGAVGVTANVGTLGRAGQSLDAYVDNLSVNSTVYEFSVGEAAQAKIAVAAAVPSKTARVPRSGSVTFSSPRSGPSFSSVGTRLQFARTGGLKPGDLTVTANGQPLKLTADPAGTLSAVITPATGADLSPGSAYRTSFTVGFSGARPRAVTLTATLLAQGIQPLQATETGAKTQLQP